MTDLSGRKHCEWCDQWVLPGLKGYGPWCELYFAERGFACMPKALTAYGWLFKQGRFEEAEVLVAWMRKHYLDWFEVAQ